MSNFIIPSFPSSFGSDLNGYCFGIAMKALAINSVLWMISTATALRTDFPSFHINP